jgi:hypothetical protein
MIKNDNIKERVGVYPIVLKIVETRLGWFGHVERKCVNCIVRKFDQMELFTLNNSPI